ncbi:MAG: hypothetical protein KAT34_13280, partial [Candidatus Aminicenantes bacterium]|nr:hypothetical protein [Candidatus Aminicenantes bacterium]
FDMLRICTEFHLKFNTEKPISEILETLDNYKSIDPFSGKSYLYNEKKKIIYSVGINRVDDGGKDTKDDRGKTPDLVISLGL